MTQKNQLETYPHQIPIEEPIRPESWECCGSDCGDACIQTIYWQEKARYDAQQQYINASTHQPQ